MRRIEGKIVKKGDAVILATRAAERDLSQCCDSVPCKLSAGA